MASTDDAVMANEIAVSLATEEIPLKLRCPACNKLAVGAFRMPCCEQSICETCQASLSESCPICLHSPVQPEDCKPTKALRTTIKAFLKKKVMERMTAKKREEKEKVVVLPPVSAASVAVNPSITFDMEKGLSKIEESPSQTYTASLSIPAQISNEDGQRTAEDPQMDVPRPSIETSSDVVDSREIQDPSKAIVDSKTNGAEEKQFSHNGGQQLDNTHWSTTNGMHRYMPGGGLDFNDMNDGFPNMGLTGGGDMNQIIQSIPNNIPANMMAGFPNMMGMPGMVMDSMAMSHGMYGGLGGQGMGINGMDMGMGLGFDATQGAFGGFAGQPASWNAGQDNYNQNAYGGHANGMAGDFGSNAGYGGSHVFSHQGNYNQMHQQQYPHHVNSQNGSNSQGFQNRGRGRRGGYDRGRGRGNYHHMQGSHANNDFLHHQQQSDSPMQNEYGRTLPLRRGSPVYDQQETRSGTEAQAETKQAELNTIDASDKQVNGKPNPGDDHEEPANFVTCKTENAEQVANPPLEPTDETKKVPVVSSAQNIDNNERIYSDLAAVENLISTNDDQPRPRPTQSEVDSRTISMPPPGLHVPLGPAALYSQDSPRDLVARGRGAGRGSYQGNLDGRGRFRGRGYGGFLQGNSIPSSSVQALSSTGFPAVSPVKSVGLGVEGAPKAPRALRDGHANTASRGGSAGRGFSIVGRASAISQSHLNGSTKTKSPSPTRRRTKSRSTSTPRHRPNHHRKYREKSETSLDDEEKDNSRRKEHVHRHTRRYGEEGKAQSFEGQDDEDLQDSAVSGNQVTSLNPSSRHSSRQRRRREKDRSSNGHHHRRERSKHGDHEEERGHRRKLSHSRSPRPESSAKSLRVHEASSTPREKGNGLSRKRRDYERDESANNRRDPYRERKRSRRDRSISTEQGRPQRSSKHSKHDLERDRERDRYDSNKDKNEEASFRARGKKDGPNVSGPPPSEEDHHTLEREARNRERLQKELQRREAMEGQGTAGTVKKRRSSPSGPVEVKGRGRRISYKYEDDESDEARDQRVESEREAGRWR